MPARRLDEAPSAVTGLTGAVLRDQRLIVSGVGGLYNVSLTSGKSGMLDAQPKVSTPYQPYWAFDASYAFDPPVDVGGATYALNDHELIRTDGTVAGTTPILTIAQLGGTFSKLTDLVASRDGRWLYLVATRDNRNSTRSDDRWQILRIAADGSGSPHAIADAPDGWAGVRGTPDLIAAQGDDVVFNASDPNMLGGDSTWVVGQGQALTKLVYAGESPAAQKTVAIDEGFLLVMKSSDEIVALVDGRLRGLGKIHSEGLLSYAGGTAYALMSNKASGVELYKFRPAGLL